MTKHREKKRVVSVYLRPELINRIKTAANLEMRSFSNYIESELENALAMQAEIDAEDRTNQGTH